MYNLTNYMELQHKGSTLVNSDGHLGLRRQERGEEGVAAVCGARPIAKLPCQHPSLGYCFAADITNGIVARAVSIAACRDTDPMDSPTLQNISTPPNVYGTFNDIIMECSTPVLTKRRITNKENTDCSATKKVKRNSAGTPKPSLRRSSVKIPELLGLGVDEKKMSLRSHRYRECRLKSPYHMIAGDNTIVPSFTTENALHAIQDTSDMFTGPTITSEYARYFSSNNSNFFVRAHGDGFTIRTDWHRRWNIDRDGEQIVTESDRNVCLDPMEPFQYTRIIMAQVSVEEANVPLPAEICATGGGRVDPKKLQGELSGLINWHKDSWSNLAQSAVTNLTYYDNTSLYLKGFFTSLLYTRLRQQHIPIAYPALIQAPVQYMRAADIAPASPQQTIFDWYVNRGHFVLYEGFDFHWDEIVELHMLAMGGVPFPINPQDPHIAANTLRWPRIRFLVICKDAPQPFPVQPMYHVARMTTFLLRLAHTRSELDFAARGWYQAAMLVSCEWIRRLGELRNGENEDGEPQWHDVDHPQQLPAPYGPQEVDDPDNFQHPDAPQPDPDAPAGAPPPAQPPPVPDVRHWRWDNDAGGPGDDALYHALGPLHLPCLLQAAEADFNRRHERWRADRQRWYGQAVINHENAVAGVERRNAEIRAHNQRQPDRPQNEHENPDAPVLQQYQDIAAEPVLEPPPAGYYRPANIPPPVWPEPDPRMHPQRADARQPAPALPDPAHDPPNMTEDEWQARARYYNYARAMTPFFECNLRLEYSKPKDTNPILRWLNVRRTQVDDIFYKDMPVFGAGFPDAAGLNLAVWMGTMVFTACTTSFYTFNITGTLLQGLVTTNHPIPDIFLDLANNVALLSRADPTNIFSTPTIAMFIRHCIKMTLKCQLTDDYFGFRDWSCWRDRKEAYVNEYLQRNWPVLAPHTGNIMATARWMENIPYEWGISGVAPHLDLSGDLDISAGTAESRGWYAFMGSEAYEAAAKSGTPYALIGYGAHVYNCIWQILNDEIDIVQPQNVPLPWAVGGKYRVQLPVVYPPGTVVIPDEFRLLMPCTLPTFIWDTRQVASPFLSAVDLTRGGLSALDKVRGGEKKELGYSWYMTAVNERPYYGGPTPDTGLAQMKNLAISRRRGKQPFENAAPSSTKSGTDANPPVVPPSTSTEAANGATS